MPRRPTGPRYFESRGGYYCQLNGQQHLLAKGPKDAPKVERKARQEFERLTSFHGAAQAGDSAKVADVIEHHLLWVRANLSKNTLDMRAMFLQSFYEHVGARLRVGALKKHHVQTWLDAKKQPRWDPVRKKTRAWTSQTRRSAIDAVVTALNWAVDQGLITRNPVARFRRPPSLSRGRKCLVSDAQHRLFYARASRRRHGGFAYLLAILRGTGARPGEVCHVEARHYDPAKGTFLVDPAEGGNELAHKGKRREIYLPPALRKLVAALCARYPSGPLIRDEHGQKFTHGVLVRRFLRLKEAVNRAAAARGEPPPVPPGVTLYGYRHKFATDWLAEGRSVKLLADLLGTSVAMIEKHYGHPEEWVSRLRQAVAEFRPDDDVGLTPQPGGVTS